MEVGCTADDPTSRVRHSQSGKEMQEQPQNEELNVFVWESAFFVRSVSCGGYPNTWPRAV